MPAIIEVPAELVPVQLPEGSQHRLQFLLGKQDVGENLSEAERQQIEGLVDVAEFLLLLKLKSQQAK
jgi:hypothetical protein